MTSCQEAFWKKPAGVDATDMSCEQLHCGVASRNIVIVSHALLQCTMLLRASQVILPRKILQDSLVSNVV